MIMAFEYPFVCLLFGQRSYISYVCVVFGANQNENRVRIEGLSRQLKGNRRAMRDSFKFGDENV